MEGLTIEITPKHVLVFVSMLLVVVSLASLMSCIVAGRFEPKNSADIRREFYRGHSYLIYNGFRAMGFLHDPDCEKCLTAKEKNDVEG